MQEVRHRRHVAAARLGRQRQHSARSCSTPSTPGTAAAARFAISWEKSTPTTDTPGRRSSTRRVRLPVPTPSSSTRPGFRSDNPLGDAVEHGLVGAEREGIVRRPGRSSADHASKSSRLFGRGAGCIDEGERDVDHRVEIGRGDALVGRVDVGHPVREVDAGEAAGVEDVRVRAAARERVARPEAGLAQRRRGERRPRGRSRGSGSRGSSGAPRSRPRTPRGSRRRPRSRASRARARSPSARRASAPRR